MKQQTIILLLVSTIFFQCTKNNQNITISGTLLNVPTDSLYLLNNYGDTIRATTRNADNTFDFEIDKSEEDYYVLNFGIDINKNYKQLLYLKPGDNLHIMIDSLKLTFSKNGAERNQYLYDKSTYEWYNHWVPFYGKIERESFYRDSVTNCNKVKVKTLINDSKFIERELKNIDYDYASFIYNVQNSLDSIISNDVKWAKSIKSDNKIELKRSKDYIRLVVKLMTYRDTLSMEELNSVYNTIGHKKLQDIFIKSMIGFMNPLQEQLQNGTDSYEKAVVVKEFVETNYPHLIVQFNPIFKIYQKFHNAEGKKASFSYEDINGKIVNLSDFEGKYVYIDFWATWCGWCIKEFPYANKIKKQFKGKNIKFVTISIDSEEKKNSWKEYVIKKKLEGIQLISPLKKGKTQEHTSFIDKGEIEDPFLTLLHVNDFNMGIPQFSLIGPDGKILDASAPRPSNENIIDYLNQYLE